MKEISSKYKKNIFKKFFIKFCRKIGYEIIDQNNFYIPTQEKMLNQSLSILGKKSITIPLGETKITRSVKDLTVIFRSCTNVNMLTQNKKRLFNKEKSEYTLRSLNSIIVSLNYAKTFFPKLHFKIIIIDHNSKKIDLDKMRNLLSKSNLDNLIINLDTTIFKNGIKSVNEENKNVTDNQISNMSNIHKSLITAKENCKDLIYFVEDDYLHQKDAFTEMIFTYERLSSQTNSELFLCPIDYPYLYSKIDTTNIFLGSKKHWRIVGETLCTFLTSAILLEKHWSKLISMCQFEHYPFEKPLHEIYKSEYCLSPIPSLAVHFTNINSIYGLSPAVDWLKIWEENKVD